MARSKPPHLAPLAPILQQFSRSRVVVVGDFVADEYVYGETERISREAPVLIVRYERSDLAPSGAVFFFNDTATTEIYTRYHTLSLHDALPIWNGCAAE
jgi:bifunctional ADP-heptose synthase (sugar kinase/adenylyltransferase)